jgi:cytochrome P450
MVLDPIAAVTAADPYPYYRALVAERPVYRDEALGLWVVSGASAVSAVLGNPAARVRPVSEPVPKALAGGAAGIVFGEFARMTDGPGQEAMKRAIRAALSTVTADRVSALACEWLADRLGEGEPVCDSTLNEIVFALPVAVMAALLGVPRTQRAALCASVAAFVAGIAPTAPVERVAAANRSAEHMLGTLRPLLAQPDGVLPALRAAAAGAPAAADAANALGLLSQTYEATAGLVGNVLLAVSRHRDAYVRAANRTRLQAFVAEVQRHDPPIHNTRRFLASDVRLEGSTLREGEAVLVVLAAANHDAAANASPGRFDIDRADRRSFTFGAGRHACPGEIIAIAVAAVAAEILVPRLTDLDRLAERVAYRASPNARIPVFGGRDINARGGSR